MGKLFTPQSQILTTLEKQPFENIVEKGENAGKHHFLLFPHGIRHGSLVNCLNRNPGVLGYSRSVLFRVSVFG